jgi:putative endonuclease
MVQSVRPTPFMHGIEKRIVYVIVSDRDPNRRYVGLTNDMVARLEWHNAGPCGYTIQHRPWRVLVTIEFPSESAAARFEKYLKSGSGRAFAKRHFDPDSNRQ